MKGDASRHRHWLTGRPAGRSGCGCTEAHAQAQAWVGEGLWMVRLGWGAALGVRQALLPVGGAAE